MRYDLIDKSQAKRLMTMLWPKVLVALDAGRNLTLEVKDKQRSNEQNEKYHAIIGDIAKQAQHMGAKWSAEDWKRMLVWQYCKDNQLDCGKVIPSLDMTGIVQLGIQTRKFTKEQASEFVEFLQAWCATNGIELNEKTLQS
jgi:hypothetical protein